MRGQWLSSVVLGIISLIFVITGILTLSPVPLLVGVAFGLLSWIIWPYDHWGPGAKPPSSTKQGGSE